MALVLKTAPTLYPVTQEEVREHLRMSEQEFLARLNDMNRLMADGTAFAEDYTWRALLTQTWEYYLDAWPEERHIVIPKPPLKEVEGVYYTKDGAASETEFEDYDVNDAGEPARIVLKRLKSWPTDTIAPAKPIRIEFDCGYGDERNDVPVRIRQAILLHINMNHNGINLLKAITTILRDYRVRNWQYA